MGFDIDYIHVGDGERSGDAIALRFGNLTDPTPQQTIIVIDGGTKESGQKLVDHIKAHYKTTVVDAVFVTHQDADHSSGLTVVLEQLDVKHLYMHVPWDHEKEMQKLFQRPIPNKKFEQELQKSFDNIRDLEEIAFEKEIPIDEPFEGMANADRSLHVLGPTKEYYECLLAEYDNTPEANRTAVALMQKTLGINTTTVITDFIEKVEGAAEAAIEWVEETLDPATETLDDSGTTSPANNSSVILLLTIDGKKLLFTGDAGIPALTAAADYAESMGIMLDDLYFLHVPHHGSKHNVGKTILDRIKAKKAQVSAALKAPKHPSKKVVNALIRRGTNVYGTKGQPIHHRHNAPDRGWSQANPLPFNDKVEKE